MTDLFTSNLDPHLQIFLGLAGLMATWGTILYSVNRLLIKKCMGSLDCKRTDASGKSLGCSKLDIAILQVEKDLPLQYMRKEDFIRFEVGINYKLDKLRDLVEQALKEA